MYCISLKCFCSFLIFTSYNLSRVIAADECWWTGCQLDSWRVVGCSQYNKIEREFKSCTGGKEYRCCPKPTQSNIDDSTTFYWSGYTWEIKEAYHGPGPNHFTRSSVQFANNKVIMTIKPLPDGKWSSAEIYTTASLGHGTYQWTIDSETALYPAQAVLGLFTWEDDSADVSNREIDVEISKFGSASDPTNAQFTLQPYTIPGNNIRLTIKPSSGPTHTEFTWSPCGVTFRLTKKGDQGDQFFNHTNSKYRLSHNNEKVHINLWLFGGQAPIPKVPVSATISSFRFLTLEETNPEYIVRCN